MLDRLEAADRDAELVPSLGVFDRHVEHSARQPDELSCGSPGPTIERAPGSVALGKPGGACRIPLDVRETTGSIDRLMRGEHDVVSAHEMEGAIPEHEEPIGAPRVRHQIHGSLTVFR